MLLAAIAMNSQMFCENLDFLKNSATEQLWQDAKKSRTAIEKFHDNLTSSYKTLCDKTVSNNERTTMLANARAYEAYINSLIKYHDQGHATFFNGYWPWLPTQEQLCNCRDMVYKIQQILIFKHRIINHQ